MRQQDAVPQDMKMHDIVNFLSFPKMPKAPKIKVIPNFGYPICTFPLLLFYSITNY